MHKFYQIIAFASVALLLGCGCEKSEDSGKTEKPYVKLGFSEKLVSNKAGSFEVFVSSNTVWRVESQADWMSVTPSEGEGGRNVIVSYEENPNPGEERTGILRFSADGTIPSKITVKQGARTFRNPVFMPMPDPYIWRDEDGSGVFYYPCKSNGNGVNLGKSNKLTEWGGTKEVWHLPSDGATKVWNRANLWAPELFRIDGDWYIYYAAGRPTSETNGSYSTQRTGVLRCKGELDPLVKGNWEDMGMIYTGNDYKPGIKPTVENTIYAIDMTTFEMNGRRYAVWSGNTSSTDGSQRLYIATMENPWTINSSRVEISRPELGWETVKGERINEGPAVITNPKTGQVFVVYSANASWKKEYCLGWVTIEAGQDPMVSSNWKKSLNHVFWRVDNVSKSDNPNVDDAKNPNTLHIGGVHGVGHNTFTKSPDGTEDWIVYHTKRYKDEGWDNRDCFIQKFTWKEDGTPDFGKPVGWQEDIEVPSGEPL